MKRFAAVVFAGIVVVFALATASASAAVTASQVTTPGNPTYYDPDLDNPAPILVSGTATADPGDTVDIRCVNDPVAGQATHSVGFPMASDVPVTAGQFSVTTDSKLDRIDEYNCLLIAVPHGSAGPWDTSAFQGPELSVAGYQGVVQGSPTFGPQQTSFQQFSVSHQGIWKTGDSSEFVEESFPTADNGLTRDEGNVLFQSSGMNDVTLDGAPALFSATGNPHFDNYIGIINLAHTANPTALPTLPGTGLAQTSEIEPLMLCVTGGGCPDYQPADPGIRVNQTVKAGDAGQSLTATQKFNNTTGTAKTLAVHYSFQANGNFANPLFKFPGDTAYASHTTLDTIPLPGGVNTYYVGQGDASCPGISQPCGAITWSKSPGDLTVSNDQAFLDYTISIPAGGSTSLSFIFDQGTSLAAVDGLATAAQNTFGGLGAGAGGGGNGGAGGGTSPGATPPVSAPPAAKKCKKKKKKKSRAAVSAKKKKKKKC